MEDTDELGYYSSEEYEPLAEEWSFEEAPIIRTNIFQPDVFSGILTRDIPELLLHMDANTLQQFCVTNKRIRYICDSAQFWYLKLKQDYPDYLLYYQNLGTRLGKLIYQDMKIRSKNYYIIYTYFRDCQDTSENTIFTYTGEKSIESAIKILWERSHTEHTLEVLLSLTLPYAAKSFEKDTQDQGYKLLSRDTLL